MLRISQALTRVSTSPTIAMTQKARDLKAAGRDVISLTAGEPDFDTPAHIAEAGAQAITEGRTRYTAVDGIPELKAAICAKFARDNDLTVTPDQVTVGTGGKQVLFNALMATLDPGDEVVIPAPYWVSYPDIVRLTGATPVIVPCPDFTLSPDALEAALTPHSRWLILNTPGNPTGAVYSAEALRALAEVLRRWPDVMVLSDDIYEAIVFDGSFATLAQVAPDLADRCLTMNGVSKAHAMTGWRIGYAAGPKPLIDAMRRLQGQSTSNPCSIAQWAALAALEGPQDHLTGFRAAYLRRRDLVLSLLADAPGLSCDVPGGAFYVYPSIAGCLGKVTAGGTRIDSDEDFAMALLDEAGVGTVFGAAFGLSPHIRISYAASDEALREACGRIVRFCEALR